MQLGVVVGGGGVAGAAAGEVAGEGGGDGVGVAAGAEGALDYGEGATEAGF